MNAAWWGKEASPSDTAEARLQGLLAGAVPSLVVASRAAVTQDVLSRAPGYTWEWTNRRATDAGVALAKLFGEEMEPVLERLNRLPEKVYVEFLSDAGIQPRPAIPAQAFLQFTVSDSSPIPVPVPAGFQLSASAAGGGAPVIFETMSDLSAIPGKIQQLFAVDRGTFHPIDATRDDVAFQPFGDKPKPGSAFFIGIATGADADFGQRLSLGVQLQLVANTLPPIATGGIVPLPVPLGPFLQWQVLDGASFADAQVESDETKGLLQSGAIVLRLPDTWAPAILPGSGTAAPLRWLRLRIAYGTFLTPPSLLSVKLNMVRAQATRTIRNEILTPNTGRGGLVMRLSQTPIVPASLYLEVDDTADLSIAGVSGVAVSAATGEFSGKPWRQVDDLESWGPDDEVYVLNAATGEVFFGDDVHGKKVPPGFRNVRAASYQVGGGSNGAVGADKISGMVNSIPFLTAVTNPLPASGGMDAETQDDASQRGPIELRARGRAVAPADYEILALSSKGAQVARAHAVPGFHPAFPGMPIPGVVCVFVVPVVHGSGPPVPDQDTLHGVSSSLSGSFAPAGVEVVAAAPYYHRVRVIVTVVVRDGADRSDAVRDVLAFITQYLDPVNGGDDGQGWPFGGTLSYVALVRKLLAEMPSISAIDRLQFVVDGVRYATCQDAAIRPNALIWGSSHEILAIDPGEAA